MFFIPRSCIRADWYRCAMEAEQSGRAGSSVTFHSLRHTFVSLLKVTGSSQSVAKELAGHSSDQVNDLYTHVPEEALVKAIKALPSFS